MFGFSGELAMRSLLPGSGGRGRLKTYGPEMVLEALEERIVLDAAVDPAPQDNASDFADTDTEDQDQDGSSNAAGGNGQSGQDAGAEALSQVFEQDLRVVLISNALDQIEALSDAAADDSKVMVYDAASADLPGLVGDLGDLVDSTGRQIGHLALFTHGDPGVLKLGSQSIFSAYTVESAPAAWQSLGDLMAEGGRIDLYGCDIGQGESGLDLVDAISDLTGATVWASDDTTGNSSDADWVLEVKSGQSTLDGLMDFAVLEDIPIVLDNSGMTNAGFETGDLTGWTTVNDVTIVDATTGTHYAGYTDDPENYYGDVSAWMVRLDGQDTSGGDVSAPSQISQEFTYLYDDDIVFAYDFVTQDGDPYGNYDEFRYILSVNSTEELNVFINSGDVPGNSYETFSSTGWQEVTIDLSTYASIGDTIKLEIHAGNTLDALADSWAFIDLRQPPEPTDPPLPNVNVVVGDPDTLVDLDNYFYDVETPPTDPVYLIYNIVENTNPALFDAIYIGAPGPDDVLTMDYSDVVGTTDITISATDEQGGVVHSTFTVSVYDSVNDPPVVTVPGAQTVDEDTPLTINGISVDDPDVALEDLQITIRADNGTLTLAETRGLVFTTGDGENDAEMVFTSWLSALNDALDGLVYQGDQDYYGGDTVTIIADDLGHTGAGGAMTDSDTISITLNPVNDAPVNTAPAYQGTHEDLPLVFSASTGNEISISDVDGMAPEGTGQLQVDLTAADGTITLSGTAGLVVVGDGTAAVRMVGAIDDINAAMDGMTFTPTSGFYGDTSLTIATRDLGNYGSGGEQFDTDTVAIGVTGSVIFNPSFEYEYKGWDLFEDSGTYWYGTWGIAEDGETIDSGESTYDYYDGRMVQQTSSGLPHTYEATHGNYLSYQLQRGAETHTMAQTFTLGANVQTLDWDMWYYNYNGSSNNNQYLMVTIDGDTLFSTRSGGTPQTLSDMEHFSYDISAYAGQTVEIKVEMKVRRNYFPAAFDNFVVNHTPTTSGIATVDVQEDAADTEINLYPSFADRETPDGELVYTIENITNAALFDLVDISDPTNLILDYAEDQYGKSEITIRATDTGGLWVETTFGVAVHGVNDAPEIVAPDAQATETDTAIYFYAGSPNEISITDVDGAAPESTDLRHYTYIRVTDDGGAGQGILTLGDTTGLTVYSNNNWYILVRGELADINNALDGLVYTPPSGFSGDLNLWAWHSDRGNWGEDGATLTDTHDMVITVAPSIPQLDNASFEVEGAVAGSGSYEEWTLEYTSATVYSEIFGIMADGATIEYLDYVYDHKLPASYPFNPHMVWSEGLLNEGPYEYAATDGGFTAALFTNYSGEMHVYQDHYVEPINAGQQVTLSWDFGYYSENYLHDTDSPFDEDYQYLALNVLYTRAGDSEPFQNTDTIFKTVNGDPHKVAIDAPDPGLEYEYDISKYAGQIIRVEVELQHWYYFMDVSFDNFEIAVSTAAASAAPASEPVIVSMSQSLVAPDGLNDASKRALMLDPDGNNDRFTEPGPLYNQVLAETADFSEGADNTGEELVPFVTNTAANQGVWYAVPTVLSVLEGSTGSTLSTLTSLETELEETLPGESSGDGSGSGSGSGQSTGQGDGSGDGGSGGTGSQGSTGGGSKGKKGTDTADYLDVLDVTPTATQSGGGGADGSGGNTGDTGGGGTTMEWEGPRLARMALVFDLEEVTPLEVLSSSAVASPAANHVAVTGQLAVKLAAGESFAFDLDSMNLTEMLA